jgi:hypothetical protein
MAVISICIDAKPDPRADHQVGDVWPPNVTRLNCSFIISRVFIQARENETVKTQTPSVFHILGDDYDVRRQAERRRPSTKGF